MKVFLLGIVYALLLSVNCVGQGLDSLKKYSYLIMGLKYEPIHGDDKNNPNNYLPVYNGTGFFLIRNDSNFFCSARHVVTNTDVYRLKEVEFQVDYLAIRSYDSVGQLNYQVINAVLLKNSTPIHFLATPDIECIFVNDIPKKIKLNYLNAIILQKPKRSSNLKASYVGFGFPETDRLNYINTTEYIKLAQPVNYNGELGKEENRDPDLPQSLLDSLYLTTKSNALRGFSGSPVFKHCRHKKREWVEFAGMISGSSIKYKSTYLVKKKFLMSFFD